MRGMWASWSRRLCALLFALAFAPCAGASPASVPTTVEVTLSERPVRVDVYRPAGTPRGAVILSHGFTRSRTTLGGHAAAIAEAGAIALTPDMPYTFDFRRNAQGLSDLVARLRAGCPLGAPVDRWLAT
jgi:hypothetical protein